MTISLYSLLIYQLAWRIIVPRWQTESSASVAYFPFSGCTRCSPAMPIGRLMTTLQRVRRSSASSAPLSPMQYDNRSCTVIRVLNAQLSFPNNTAAGSADTFVCRGFAVQLLVLQIHNNSYEWTLDLLCRNGWTNLRGYKEYCIRWGSRSGKWENTAVAANLHSPDGATLDAIIAKSL